MKSDFHLHSNYSGDSTAPLTSMIEKGIQLGLTTMCFTDHQDFDYVYDCGPFPLKTEAYVNELLKLQEYYKDKINVLIGVEIGLQPYLKDTLIEYVDKYPFDFIIGSSHSVHGIDPYYPEFFSGKTEQEAVAEYFASIIENVQQFSSFQVYGHLDYIIRYCTDKDKHYSYHDYVDIIDELLTLLIYKNIGIEINTAGLKYGLKNAHPHPEIIKRYRELGGEIITVGSDAHKPEHVAYEFQTAESVLKACGFHYYTIFKERKPQFIPLSD